MSTKILTLPITRFITIGRHFWCSPSRIDLNVLFGGHINATISEPSSVGRFLYDRLSDPSRADKIIQICATTGNSMNTNTFLKQSIAVAEGLQEHSIQRGDFVLLAGYNSLHLNVAVIGILLLGAVPVPISQYANPGDLKYMLTIHRPKFLICDNRTLFLVKRIVTKALGRLDVNQILLLDEPEKVETGPKTFSEFIKGKGEKWETFTPVEIKAPKEDLALVMKSFPDVSGSSESAIGLTHFNILSSLSRYEDRRESVRDEVILMVQKIIWMSGLHLILLASCFGCRLVVMSDFDEESFMKAIETYKVTTSLLYPLKVWQLYKHNYHTKYDVSSCKAVHVAGLGIPKVLIRLMKKKTGLLIKPAYAKPEMSGIILESVRPLRKGSMGRLVPMVYAKVVQLETKENCGPNVPGEVCFKGPTLMKSYISESQTQSIIDEDGFFHTGDYGYYDEEGFILVLGKIKENIKYRNYQINPLEVEGTLKSHDSIKDCVVGGIAHPEDGHRIIAFVVLQPGKTTTADEIHEFLKDKLPEHKLLKGGIVFIQKVPRMKDSNFIRRHMIRKILSKYQLESHLKDSESASEEMKQEKKEHKSE